MEHQELWKVLREIGVAQCYIQMLQKLYARQVATDVVGTESRPLSLMRGVKQGDPISGLLFIAVMEVCFRELKTKWGSLNKKRSGQYFGMVVDNPLDPMTNLRFADDVLLVAQSLSDARKMISQLRDVAAQLGLILHMGKTKFMANTVVGFPKSVPMGCDSVDVLDTDMAEKYLGRKVCLGEYHQTELANRIRFAWAAFTKYKVIFVKSLFISIESKVV